MEEVYGDTVGTKDCTFCKNQNPVPDSDSKLQTRLALEDQTKEEEKTNPVNIS